jgi:hypothetical protein
MPRWHKVQHPPPGEQSFETDAYKTEIIEPDVDAAETAAQLRHARDQIAIAEQYPGRQRSQPRDNVTELHPRLPRSRPE